MFDYWDYASRDILSPLLPAFQAKDCFMRDNKIYIPIATGMGSPWIHAKVRDDCNCNRYQRIYHSIYGFIPEKCHGCWKVVQRPSNLDELFEIYKYQKEMRLASKCGVETRKYVHGNYGAYWYNRSKEQGLERLEVVRKDFPKIPAILKRGCTEFELAYGPSDQWKLDRRTIELEEQLESILVDIWRHDGLHKKKLSGKGYPSFVNENIMRDWVEFAFDRGDPTYKIYTRGRPITPRPVVFEKDMETGCEVTGKIELAR